VKASGRTSLTAPEGKQVCDAYGIPVPKEGVATSADEAAKLSAGMGFPVVLKIVSPEILHKTEAGGVLVGVKNADEAKKGFDTIMANAKKYDAKAQLLGVQVQQMLAGGQEVIVGADPVNREALATLIENVSRLIADFPEISEMDLNPVFATKDGAIAADVRIVVNFSPAPARYRPKHEDIVRDMNRIMKPNAVAVIGASAEAGKIGNSVMKNLIN